MRAGMLAATSIGIPRTPVNMRTRALQLTTVALMLTMLNATPGMAQDKPGKGEFAQIAEQAFIYGYTLVKNYGVFYEYFIDKSGSQYKAPLNQLYNTARV